MTEDPINWPLEQKVDEFIEIVFGGKHHVQKFEMKFNHAVIVPYGSMATVDGSRLTTVVFAAHQLGLRVDIENHGMRGIRLLCHSRSVREGSLTKRHPTIIEALKQYGMEVITKAEHDAAIAKLHAQFGCELRDQNGTIWEQAAKLQRENEELLEDASRIAEEVKSVLAELDHLASVWGDEGVFRRCRDRLRKVVATKGGTDGD